MEYDVQAALSDLARRLKPTEETEVVKIKVVKRIRVYGPSHTPVRGTGDYTEWRLDIALALYLRPERVMPRLADDWKVLVLVVMVGATGDLMGFTAVAHGRRDYYLTQPIFHANVGDADWQERMLKVLGIFGVKLEDQT
jgi:hypothetical protein